MPEVPILGQVNGHDAARDITAAANARLDLVAARYPQLAGQVGALSTLLAPMPLGEMLVICKRLQGAGMLTVAPEQYQQALAGLRTDQKVIEAALNWQRILMAASQ